MLLEKIVILGKLKILSKHHTSYDVLSDHLTDKGSLNTSDLLSDNEHSLSNWYFSYVAIALVQERKSLTFFNRIKPCQDLRYFACTQTLGK